MTRKKNPWPSPASAMITTVAVLALFFAACDRGTVGIFASIEREEKTIQSNLPKDQTVKGFAETSDAYFVAIGTRIWTRSTTEDPDEPEPWKPITPPNGDDEYVATGVASSGDIVVAAYTSAGGSLITVRDAADPFTELGSVDFAGQIFTLLSPGDEIFVVERRSGGAHFFHRVNVTTPATPTATELTLPGSNPRVLDTAFHGTTYWFVTSDTVLSSTDPDVAPTVVVTAPGDNGGITNIGGIAVTDTGTVVVSSNATGKVAYSTDGGASWSQSEVAADTRFPSVAVIGETVYLGAKRGVYTLPVTGLAGDGEPGNGEPAVVTGQGYESASLRNAEVGGFFEASDGDIFILTNKGLWRRTVENDSVSWIWE